MPIRYPNVEACLPDAALVLSLVAAVRLPQRARDAYAAELKRREDRAAKKAQ